MIKLIVVGKIKKHYLNEGISYYLKQIPHKIEIIEVKDEPNESGVDLESSRILAKINEEDYVIGLVIKAPILSSESFSLKIENLLNESHKHIVFIIGGSHGFNQSVMSRLNDQISISKMTFPHQMVRLMLIEQIYRSFMIIKKHPYHK